MVIQGNYVFAAVLLLALPTNCVSSSSNQHNFQFLRDSPLQNHVEYLDDSSWTLLGVPQDTNLKIIQLANVSIPGDLLTDLENARIIPDLLLDNTFCSDVVIEYISNYTWTYSRQVSLTPYNDMNLGSTRLLVFESIKMGADIWLDDTLIGTAKDQFLRYVFPIPVDLFGNRTLRVEFNHSIDVAGRFTACSGGWDWAPYSRVTDSHGSPVFASGIVQSVYLVNPVASKVSFALEYVVPHVFYTGKYPTKRLCNRNENHAECSKNWSFQVSTKVFVRSLLIHKSQRCNLTVSGSWSNKATVSKVITLRPRESQQVQMLPLFADNDVELWWPNNLGQQHLHTVTTTIEACRSESNSSLTDFAFSGSHVETSEMGFRIFALVTADDQVANFAGTFQNTQGNGEHGLAYRINGAIMLARGANLIPSEVLEGRRSAEAYEYALESAKRAGMNTLRVWGGGLFLPLTVYRICNRLGILIYHDMMFAQLNHEPNGESKTQEEEFRHQVRRLASMPCIVVWSGCNECTVSPYEKDASNVYASFVLRVVAEEDSSRAVWPSSPSYGWDAGVDLLYSRPIPGAKLIPKDPKVVIDEKKWNVEVHGPYEHGTGWPSVNAVYPTGFRVPVAPLWQAPNFNSHAFKISNMLSKSNDRVVDNRSAPLVTRALDAGEQNRDASAINHRDSVANRLRRRTENDTLREMTGSSTPTSVESAQEVSFPALHISPRNRNQFVSEFGATSMGSYESMAGTLSPAFHTLHGGTPADTCKSTGDCQGGNVMAQRNYPCDNMIEAYFDSKEEPLDANSLLDNMFRKPLNASMREHQFKAQLYLCQIAHALHVRGQIENFRTSNKFGMLTWQLGEVWPTGGWGSLEYGSHDKPGQVTGGRWKPLHYWYRRFLFTDIFAICGVDKSTCLVRNDSIFPAKIRVLVHVPTDTRGIVKLHEQQFELHAGAGVADWFTVHRQTSAKFWFTTVLQRSVNGTWLLHSHHTQLFIPPWQVMQLTSTGSTCEPLRVDVLQDEVSGGEVPIRVFQKGNAESERMSFWYGVTLTSRAQGVFSDNTFEMVLGIDGTLKRTACFVEFEEDSKHCDIVYFIPNPAQDRSKVIQDLKDSIRIEHLGEYLCKYGSTFSDVNKNTSS